MVTCTGTCFIDVSLVRRDMRLIMSYYLNLIKLYYNLNIHTISTCVKTKNRNTLDHFSSDLNLNNPENLIVLIYNTKISFLYI